MAWTGWRKLAENGVWYYDGFDYDGPTCYELATVWFSMMKSTSSLAAVEAVFQP